MYWGDSIPDGVWELGASSRAELSSRAPQGFRAALSIDTSGRYDRDFSIALGVDVHLQIIVIGDLECSVAVAEVFIRHGVVGCDVSDDGGEEERRMRERNRRRRAKVHGFMCIPDGLGSCCGSDGNGINECI